MNYEKESEIFKALGHPMRLKIVEGLLHNQCNVKKIVQKLQLPQSTVSQHLGILKKAGVLVPAKEGVKTCYHVTNQTVLRIINALK